MRRSLAPALALVISACSEKPLELQIVLGAETDAMIVDPPVAEVTVTIVGSSGTPIATASAPPGGSLDFGEIDSDEPVTVEVDGTSTTGVSVLRGRTVTFTARGLEGAALPVFAQRLGTWSRPPGGLSSAHVGGSAAILTERFLFTTGGVATGEDGITDGLASDSYDLLALGGAVGNHLPRDARSIVARGDVLLLVGDDGATIVDFTLGETYDLVLPVGLDSFADVAGGLVVESDDGRAFIVGATRTGAPTAAVLEIGTSLELSYRSLGAERAGAAAAWLPGVGLVVAGGSATAAGAEVLAPNGTAFGDLSLDPDPVEGAAAVLTAAASLALLGGVTESGDPAPTRTFSPACPSCEPTVLPDAAIPVALHRSRGFRVAAGGVLVFGSTAAEDRCFVVTLAGSVPTLELPLRLPRLGAEILAGPNGTLAVVGGAAMDGSPALQIESYFPE